MSHQLIGRSPDLKRLRDEGYGIEIRSTKYLFIHPVPYVSATKEVAVGTLVSELTFRGNDVTTPENHVVYFIGDYPCDTSGARLTKIFNPTDRQELVPGVIVDHTFSAKPVGRVGYVNYYEKITTYVAIITGAVEEIDPTATARTYPVSQATAEESPFQYIDTASSRSEIDAVTSKLARGRVAIVGLGGTGSYVLDLVAKTPAPEIHVFDGDAFSQHNAFRCPGAPSIDELLARPRKTPYWVDKYSKMHRHIVGHDYYVDPTNVAELLAMDFVFICIDRGEARKLIVDTLEQNGKTFIDVGMGLTLNQGALSGITRVTTVTPEKHDHIADRIPFADGQKYNEYVRNIQIADLNALNAALAVIKWKKLWGFYADLEREHFSGYAVNGNTIINDETT